MPAAAVIPAPIAYIKVVAVKKLVVEFRGPFFKALRSETQLASKEAGVGAVLQAGLKSQFLEDNLCP